jgi:hypothetical protein
MELSVLSTSWGHFDHGNELLGFTEGSHASVNFSYKTLHQEVSQLN